MLARFADGEEREIDVPIKEHPLMCALVKMCPPLLLSEPDDGDRVIRIIFPAGKEFSDNQLKILAKNLGAVQVVISANVGVAEFKLLLAKIAHCMTIALFGIGGFYPFLDDILRRKDSDGVRLYVGSSLQPALSQGTVHYLSARYVRRGRQKLIVVRVCLFGYLDFPSYEVVSGRIYENFPDVAKEVLESEDIKLSV